MPGSYVGYMKGGKRKGMVMTKMKIPFLPKRKSSGDPKPKKQKRQVTTPSDDRRGRQQDYLKRIEERRKALR